LLRVPSLPNRADVFYTGHIVGSALPLLTNTRQNTRRPQKFSNKKIRKKKTIIFDEMSRDSSATGCGPDGCVSIPGSVQTGSGLTKHLIEWVPEFCRQGLSRWGVNLSTHLHLEPCSRMIDLYLLFPVCLYGVMFN
jgi:hypothetical protein